MLHAQTLSLFIFSVKSKKLLCLKGGQLFARPAGQRFTLQNKNSFWSLLWYFRAVQSESVFLWQKQRFVLAACFQLSISHIEQHFSTPQSTWTEPSWVQLTAVCSRRSSSPDKHVIKSFSLLLDPRRLKHVKVCSDATTGFIVTLDSVAGGTCKSQRQLGCTYFSCMRQGESTARWADEESTQAKGPGAVGITADWFLFVKVIYCSHQTN